MTTALIIDSVYNFTTRAPSILGTGYNNVKLEAIMSQSKAVAKFPHIVARYRQVYPLLPTGTPDRAGRTTYYIFKTLSGEDICLAEEWIDMSQLRLVSSENWLLHFQGSVADMERIRAFLAVTGMPFTITQA
jgi:hypothetical protein